MTQRENHFAGQPTEKVADVMAGCQANSTNDQMAKAEFMLRQTQAAEKSATCTEKYTRYMFWSVVVLAGFSLLQFVLQLLTYLNTKK